MYKPEKLNILFYFILILIISLIYYILSADYIFSVILIAFAIWLSFRLNGMSINLDKEYLVRKTGRIIQSKTMIKIDNISAVKIISIFDVLPAFMRIYYPDDSIVIIGLSSRQIRDLADKLT